MPGTDSDERWRRQFEIFDRALEKEPGERSAFVEGACGDDQCLPGLDGAAGLSRLLNDLDGIYVVP